MNKSRGIIEGLADLLYPDSLYCMCCDKIIDDSRPYSLCNECMDEIKWINDRCCDKCGKRLSAANPGSVCFSCKEHSHVFDRGYCCAEYGEHERAIVFGLKYGNRSDIARRIAEIMNDRMSADSELSLRERYDLLVPVPMFRPKQRLRGYNQSALIAGELAKLSRVRYVGEILERTRETRALKGLSPTERRNEMRGVFRLIDKRSRYIDCAQILLIDDIYTTGATMDECALCLKEGGAYSVDILSFAAGADVVKSM